MVKNLLLISLVAAALAGCQRVGIEVKTETLTNKSDRWEVNIEKSIFSSADKKAGEGCAVVNQTIQQLQDSLVAGLKEGVNDFYASLEGTGQDSLLPNYRYQLYLRDTVYMATDACISVRVMVYEYQGGAHGLTNFYSFNYDLKNRQYLTEEQVIDYKKAEEVNELLKKNFNNEEGCFSDVPTLTNGFTAWNISPVDICLTYPAYTLGAYACGNAMVTIPMAEAKTVLTPEARQLVR